MSIISDLDKFNRGLATFDFIKRKRKFLSIFEAELDDSVSLDFRLTLETFRVESVDLSDNRLICAFATRYVTLHDMTPVYEEPYLYPQVGQTMCPVASTSVQIGNECVRWRSYDCGLFSVTGNFPTLNVYDTEKVSIVTSFLIPETNAVYQHCFNPLQQSLIGCVGATKAHIVDLRTGNNLQATCGNFGCMVSIAWSPSNENLFFTASSCGEIVAWDSRVFRKSLARSTLYPPRNVFMTPELQFDDYGNHLLCLTTDQNLKEIDQKTLKTRLLVGGLNISANQRRFHYSVTSLTKPPLIFVPNGKNVSVYDLNTGELLKNFTGHTRSVLVAKYNEYNDELYSTGDDFTFCIWRKIRNNVF